MTPGEALYDHIMDSLKSYAVNDYELGKCLRTHRQAMVEACEKAVAGADDVNAKLHNTIRLLDLRISDLLERVTELECQVDHLSIRTRDCGELR